MIEETLVRIATALETLIAMQTKTLTPKVTAQAPEPKAPPVKSEETLAKEALWLKLDTRGIKYDKRYATDKLEALLQSAEAAPTTPQEAPKAEAPALTPEQMFAQAKESLKQYAAKHGVDKASEVLKKFGGSRLSQLNNEGLQYVIDLK